MHRAIAVAAVAALALAQGACASKEERLSRIQRNYYERIKEHERLVELERKQYAGFQESAMALDRQRIYELRALRSERDTLRRAIERILLELRAGADPTRVLRRIGEIAHSAKSEADEIEAAAARGRASAILESAPPP